MKFFADRFSRSGLYYGWVILFVVTWLQIATSPGQTFGIAAFNPSLQTELQLTASQLSSAYLFGTLLGCLGLPVAGSAMDRFGPKKCLLAITGGFALACCGMSRVTDWFGLVAAFTSLRMLGQGALNLCSSSSLAYWFDRRLGLASGISAIGMPLAFAIMPGFILWLIEQYGWRNSYVVLGAIVWSVSWLLLLLFFHDRPEAVGLRPDGAAAPATVDGESSAEFTDNFDISLGDAMRTGTFWVLVAISAAWSATATGVIFYLIPIYEEQGFSAQAATVTFPVLAVLMTSSQFVTGAMAHRLSARFMLMVACGMLSIGLASLAYLPNTTWSYGYAIGLGVAHGVLGVLHHVFWPRYYGLTHLGRIRGFVWMMTVAGSSVGPFILGLSRDYAGGFLPGVWAFAIFTGLLTLSAAFVRPPNRTRTVETPRVADQSENSEQPN